ncbi:hypothetical protein DAEQUDRAFT_732799 [Daedalea quercina L-15889]|uniref:Uncharacterized protein n=1 Tax=Daedalea quercina L-15889 TaxID=1314783 RepID=A0A165LE05_9APHY|nr:hypothetical protein DAEQUDRAFT_732799 [Daedalea quercina L-15889]
MLAEMYVLASDGSAEEDVLYHRKEDWRSRNMAKRPKPERLYAPKAYTRAEEQDRELVRPRVVSSKGHINKK